LTTYGQTTHSTRRAVQRGKGEEMDFKNPKCRCLLGRVVNYGSVMLMVNGKLQNCCIRCRQPFVKFTDCPAREGKEASHAE
jgi:hypothetical protein